MTIITISEHIKGEIAEKVALECSAGYDSDVQGLWYVVNGSSVVHYNSSDAWTPWSDDDATINVNDLAWHFGGAEGEGADFENGVDGADDHEQAVEFALGYVPDSYDADDWAAHFGDGR
jgi:hypothetical protein